MNKRTWVEDVRKKCGQCGCLDYRKYSFKKFAKSPPTWEEVQTDMAVATVQIYVTEYP